jgi:predicted metal-dependent phosphoesterase TrpH
VAHPRQIRIQGRPAYEAFFRRLQAAGLAGIEVDHPSHRPEDRRLFASLAGALDLVASGGSDFHGDNKPFIALGKGDGTIDVPHETWAALSARMGR